MYIFEYIFKYKYALCKECKTKNMFLKTSNQKTYFCPDLIVLSVINMHLHKYLQSLIMIIYNLKLSYVYNPLISLLYYNIIIYIRLL